jgi:hypothetical protein
MDQSDEIIVEYWQNFRDWYNSLVAAGMLSGSAYRVPLIYAGGCGILAIIGWASNVQLLASIVTALALLFIGWAWKANDLQRYEMQRRWNRSRSQELLLRVIMSDRHIAIESDQFRSEFRWSLVLRIVETEELLILVMGTGNLINLPKRSMTQSAPPRIRAFLSQNLAPATGSPIGFGVVQRKEA